MKDDDVRGSQPRYLETSEGRLDKRMHYFRGLLSDNNLFGPDEVNPDPLGGTRLVEADGFLVRGIIDAEDHYEVAVLWGGEVGSGVEIRGHDAELVRTWLSSVEGTMVDVTATGPLVEVRLDDPLGIRAAFTNLTTVSELRGDEPPGFPETVPGVVH